MPHTTTDKDMSNDPTLIPEASDNEDTSHNTAEDSEETVWNNCRCKVLFTSRSNGKYDGGPNLSFITDTIIVPTLVGEDTSPNFHQNAVASYDDSTAFQKSMANHFEKHPGPERVVFPAEIGRSDFSLIQDHMEEAQAKHIRDAVTREYETLSQGGKIPLTFDQEYLDPEKFDRVTGMK